MEIALRVFEELGVYAEGGGEAPGRRKIAGSQYDVLMGFEDIVNHIRDGRPLVGTIRMDSHFKDLGPNDIYEYRKEDCVTNDNVACTHAVIFIGFGRRAGRRYLVFLNSHGIIFGDKRFR
ncbi:hypothetical protein QOZ80_6BG0460060 [Eleusine coracana subsp. coracana]|nr:hypothetical protein QOZ80_6BG0460060 [Eleusine coracana subsp. coracana]